MSDSRAAESKLIMMNLYQLTCLLFFTLLGLSSIQAAHIIGGEMTYVCEGSDPDSQFNNLYTFTMKVYRDCQGGGAQFDSAPGAFTIGTVSVYLGNSTVEFDKILLDPPVITPIDSDNSNPCLIIPPNVCGEEGVYTFQISLPPSNESYHFVYQRCCRNNTISNIDDPGGAGSTYTIELTPLAQSECNSSPVFTNLPETVICVNEPLNIDNSAFDADGDQLVYSFCSPLTGGTNMNVAPDPDAPPPFDGVQFVLPDYSALNPFGGTPQVIIDAFSGMMTGTPTEQGQFVVGICVQEFRNGELLSTIQRDYQFNVAFCEPTVTAEIEGSVNGDDVLMVQSCVDSTFTFINESTDVQFIDSYVWTFDIPGNQPLSFDTRDVTVTLPGPGNYLGSMIVNPGFDCSDTVNLDITITPPINPVFEFDYDTCVAGPVDFTDLTSLTNPTITDWDWEFGDGELSDETNPSHMYEDPGIIPVTLTVTDSIGCTESITEDITWFPVPPLIIIEPSTFIGCPPSEIEFVNLSSPIDDTYDIQWSFGDGGVDTSISPIYTYNTPGTFDVSIEITSPIGCFTSQSFPNLISIDSLPIADFTFTPEKADNFEPEVQFTDQSIRAAAWEWTFGEFGSTISQNPSYVFPDTGMIPVQLVITHRFGCLDTLIQFVDVEPKITYFLPNAFTPNEDGKNEFFRGGGFFRGIRDFNMKIMNRWGGIIFETQDPMEAWNGRKMNSGRLSPNGVYLVYVSYTGPRGMPNEHKGYVTLIR